MSEQITDPKVDPVDPKVDPKKADPAVQDPVDPKKADPPASGFTQEDIDNAIAAAQGKWKKEQEEAARLGKLSEDDRKKEELLSKEKELHRKELLLKANDLLDERSLPVKFKDFLIGTDENATESNITAFEKEWKTALEAAVNEKLKGSTPKAGAGSPPITKEKFAQMGYKERTQLYNESPELYKQLSEEE